VEKQIVIESPDGTFGAYISRPATFPAPVVVVLQELFGVNADIRATCDELAAQGYIAIAPDLFWRQEPDVDLDVRSEADWQQGLRLYGGMIATLARAISRKQSAPLLSCPSRPGGLPCKATASAH
jgi:dienelactone hydrolase